MKRPVSELGSADPMALSSSAVGSGRASARRRLLFTSALVPALVLAGMAWDSRTSASAMSYPINPLAGGSGGDAARSGQYGGTGSAADINTGTVGGDATDPVGGGGGSGSGGVDGVSAIGSLDGGAGGGAQGGVGVYVAGANGNDGSTSTTIGQGGGGGSGGVHGFIGSTLPVADATGGNGGNGGSGNASFGGGGDGGGGGGGGFGAGVIADGALGTLSVNLTGGNGGAGGHGGTGQFASENAGGNGGAGGGGLVLTSSDATELVIAGTLLGGNGGAGGNGANSTQSLFNGGDGGNGGTGGSGAWAENTGTDVVTTLVVTGTVTGGTGGARGTLGGGQEPGAFGDYGAGGIGIGGSNLLVSLASTATVSGGLSGDGVTRANAIQFVDGVNTVLLQGNGAASGVSYATITGNVVGATGAGTSTTLELGGAGGNFDMAGFGIAAQFQDFTEVVVNTTGTWLLSGELAATGTPTQLGIEAGTLQAASAAPFGTATLALQGAGTLQATDTFTLTQAVSLAQVSGAGGGTFSVDDTKTLTLSGVVSGDGNLTKTGTGTLTLSGTNTFTGATAVSAGELVIGGGAALSDTAALTVATGATLTLFDADETVGSLAGAGTVALNGYTLTAGGDNTSTTFSGILSGTGGLTKAGTGVMTLSGANTYSGATTVSAGELVISGGASLSDTALLTVASGATLTLSDADETVGSLAGAGTVALNSYTLTVGGDDGDATFSGALTGTGGLTKIGTGTQTLSGTNTYSGATAVSAGELVIAGGASLSDTAALTVASGATLTLSDADETVGSLAGAGTVALNGYTLTAGGDNTSTTFSGVMSGTGGLTKTGTGVMTLSGANTYSGASTVSAGELVISGGSSLSDSALLTVASGATLTLSDADETVGSLAGAGTVALNSYNLITGGDNTNSTFSGILSGTGGLTKTGTGVMTLSGTNTYSGETTVSAGELVIAGGTSLSDTARLTVASGATLTLSNSDETVGSLAGAGTVALNSYNLIAGGDNTSSTFSGVMTGTGGLTKTGTGTLILTGDNTYTGTTVVSAGILQIGNGGTTGSIAGDVLNNATLIFNRSDNYTFNGDIGGTGDLKFQGTGRVTVNGTISNDVLVEGGALDLRMGSVNPGTFTVQSGGVLGGTASVGNLVVNAGGIAAPGYSPGTLTVAGTVQFNTGSTYQVDVTPGGGHDLIVAGGAVTLSTGAQVQVLAVPGVYPGVQTFAILTTSSTLTGTFGSVTSDYAFLDPYLSYDLQNVYLTLVYNGVTFASYAQTGNQTGVAWAVQALGTDNSLYQALVALPGGAVAPALNQLTGEAYASTQTVILDQSVYLREAVGARLGQAGSEGSGTSALSYAAKAAGPATARLSADWTPTLWMQGYGGWGNAFSDGNAATISSSIGGFFVGLDAPVADHARVGLLGGFSRTNMDVTDRGSSGSIDNYDLGLYAGAKYGMVGLKAGVSYSWHDVSMERTIAFPGFWGATSAGYTQGTTQVFGEVNTSFAVSSYEFEPFVGLAYVHLSSASASEAAQTPAALAVDVSGMDTFYTTLGVRAATTMQVGGRTLTPSVTVGWQHAFNDVTPYSTMRFLDGAVPFGVEGVPVAENAAVLGAGLAYALSDKANLQVNYTGQIASSAANNAFTAQFALKF